jgi:hypothetical protein
MWAQADLDGNQFLFLDSIVDHRKEGDAIDKVERAFIHKGRKGTQKTTKGWKLCIKRKDESMAWE